MTAPEPDVPSRFYVDVRDGRFALHGCGPEQSYPVSFFEPEHKWGATVTLSGKQAGGEPHHGRRSHRRAAERGVTLRNR